MLPSSSTNCGHFVGIPGFPSKGYLFLKELRSGTGGTPPNNGAAETGFLQEQFFQS